MSNLRRHNFELESCLTKLANNASTTYGQLKEIQTAQNNTLSQVRERLKLSENAVQKREHENGYLKTQLEQLLKNLNDRQEQAKS